MGDTLSAGAAVLAESESEVSRSGSLWSLLQAELSPYPGRGLLAFRMVLSCTLVMLWIIVFKVPGAALGAYYPMLVSRDNLRSTRRSAFWIATAAVLGTVSVVLGAMLFLGAPLLHLAWVCISLCAVFYLVSALRVYEAALALGLFVTTAITIWDQRISADLRLRQTLFTLLAILIGCAVAVAIEYLFSRTHPPDAVIGGIEQRLDIAVKILEERSGAALERRRLVHEVRRYSRRGTGALRELIAQSDYGFQEQQRLSTAVGLVGRLIELSSTLIETEHVTTEKDSERCLAIARNIVLIRESLSRGEIAEWIDIDDEHEAVMPILIEMERTVDLLAESLSQPMREGREKGRTRRSPEQTRIFVADAFRDSRHIKFAIRGGASAIACYMFYMSVGWVGLSASIATCVLTALPVTGASRHKQLLRFAGVVVGACVIGFTAQAVILPQIDSIFSYTLLFAAIVFLGAWIATSGPRIAYCGAQIVLAYELVNLNRFSINPSLVPARDTVLGILLAIVAMWLIFDHLWATTSLESLRSVLVRTIREIAELENALVKEGPAVEALLEARTHEIMGRFERLRTLMDVSAFEAFPKAAPDEELVQRTRDYLPQLRSILLIKTGLMQHRVVSGDYCKSDTALQIQRRCSVLLMDAAGHIEQDRADKKREDSPGDREMQTRIRTEIALARSGELNCNLTELRLCSSLFDVVRHLSATT
ncbi:MAG: FUSC family protein [Acidobacteria bacterium]|nr:FUSC family protein [Acidobacteriota bacterium]